jgi:hypothetical protein
MVSIHDSFPRATLDCPHDRISCKGVSSVPAVVCERERSHIRQEIEVARRPVAKDVEQLCSTSLGSPGTRPPRRTSTTQGRKSGPGCQKSRPATGRTVSTLIRTAVRRIQSNIFARHSRISDELASYFLG